MKGASAEPGATLQSYAKNDTVAQAFRLTYDSASGYYTIASLVSGKLIDADYGSVVPRAAAHLYGSLDDTASYTKNRFWILEPSGEGFAIKNVANGLYLSFESGVAVTSTDAATWTLTQTKGFTWTQADVDAFAAAQGLQIPDGTYALGMDSSPRSVVDVSGGSASNGANIQIYASNNTAAQRWVIKNTLDSNGQPTGYVTIAHAGTSSVLDVTGGGKKSGTNVQQYAVNGTAAQRWIPVKQANGSFVFYSGLGRNLVFDVSGGSVSNGANVQIWTANGSAAQRFIAIDANPHVAAGSQSVADGVYQINSVSDSSKCIDVTGGSVSNGARIQTYASNGTIAQCFKLSYDSATGFYSIRSAKSTKGLDLDGGDIFPGAKVQQWDFPGLGSNQQWRIEPDGNSYVIRSVASNLVLERKSDGSVTTAIEIGSAAQHWTFEALPFRSVKVATPSIRILQVNISTLPVVPMQMEPCCRSIRETVPWLRSSGLVRIIGAITRSNVSIPPSIFRYESLMALFFRPLIKMLTRPNGRLRSALERVLNLKIKRPVRCCPSLALADQLSALTRMGPQPKGGPSRPSPLFLTVSMSLLPCMLPTSGSMSPVALVQMVQTFRFMLLTVL